MIAALKTQGEGEARVLDPPPVVLDEPAEKASRFPRWLPLVLVLALATVLRFYRLGAENFWIDEIFSLAQAENPLSAIAGFWSLDERMTSRPLGLTLLYWALQLGESEFIARLPYAILSVLEVGALYLLSRDLVGRKVALRAALFLAVLPLHVWYAQEARWYAQWSLLATLSLWALLRLWKTWRPGWAIAYGVATLLDLYTFVMSIFVLITQMLTTLLLPARGPRWTFWKRAAIAMLGAVLLSLPVFLVAAGFRVEDSAEAGVGTRRATSIVVLPYTFFVYVAGYTVGPTVAQLHALPSPVWIVREYPEVVLYFVYFLPLAALGLWALRNRPASAAILLPWALGLPLLVFASAVLGQQTYNVRYSLAALPGFALLLAVGVESLGRWRSAGTLGAVGLFGLSVFNYHGNPRFDKEDVRSAIAHIQAGPEADEPVAMIGQGIVAAIHYGENLTVEQLRGCGRELSRVPRKDRQLPEIPIEEIRSEPVFWLLASRDWHGRTESCLEALDASHEVVQERSFTGVDLFLLRRHRVDAEQTQ
ncbi:MAG TPA: glycosyltransferase family 39 protein [Gemmatimonadota bacterium]|nr:glycosyltransferase family 39 protein [Gemmatimonadota bacterium]